jgi:hypothetical protein
VSNNNEWSFLGLPLSKEYEIIHSSLEWVKHYTGSKTILKLKLRRSTKFRFTRFMTAYYDAKSTANIVSKRREGCRSCIALVTRVEALALDRVPLV